MNGLVVVGASMAGNAHDNLAANVTYLPPESQALLTNLQGPNVSAFDGAKSLELRMVGCVERHD